MLRNLHILPDDINVLVEDKTILRDALKMIGIYISYPCGGKGTCGKCMVELDGVPVKGCDTYVCKDSEVFVPFKIRLSGQKIITDIRLYDKSKNGFPLVEKVSLKLNPPTIYDSTSDVSNLIDALSYELNLKKNNIYVEPQVMIDLPYYLRKNDFKVNATIFYEDDKVTVLSIADKKIYGIAVDIGTTTIALALCDLETKEVVEAYGLPNPQAIFGADVISRIIYTEENSDGTASLKLSIIQAISYGIETVSKKFNIKKSDIPVIVVAANTVMSHFLLGLPTDFLRREPFVPAATTYPIIKPQELGFPFPMLQSGRIIILPCVSSYVGGDIVAGVIATEIYKNHKLELFVDVGTNGEMILAGDGFMMACSCSAGPAFEGSGISCGSRAVEGAINNTYFKDGKLQYEVFGDNMEPVSICGSGLISLISSLLEAGIINRSGRFVEDIDRYSISKNVFITTADIQNLIRSKGAIFAGIKVLLNYLGLSLDELDHILIAGGFGRSINIKDAVEIGMIPVIHGKPHLNLKDLNNMDIYDKNYSYVGNSSLAGALRVLNDRTIDIKKIANSITNVELSIGNEFMDEFVKACFLPHTDF